MTVHPASDDDLYNLRAFDGSYRDIAHCLGDNQDILTNWWLLGVEPHGDRKRAVLLERSTLAVAFVIGDGVHFGRAAAPSAEEVGALVERYGLHWE